MIEITNKLYYVGVNDRNKQLFEGLWPLPDGVSYNSYLIDDEKVVLIDTVEVDFFVQFIENIREVIGDRKIDYLVIHHMEPDHSGGLALLKQYYPDIKVIGNKKTFDLMYANEANEDFDSSRLFAFLRSSGNTTLLIVANFGETEAHVRVNIPAHAFDYMELKEGKKDMVDLLSGDQQTAILQQDSPVEMVVAGLSGRIYKF